MRACVGLALVFLSATSARADDWPKVFLRVDGTDHTMVALYADGTAAFSQRRTDKGFSTNVLTATRANWRWCDGDEGAARGQKCLHVYVTGISNSRGIAARFDYWYEDIKLSEFDKSGIVEVLRLVRGVQP